MMQDRQRNAVLQPIRAAHWTLVEASFWTAKTGIVKILAGHTLSMVACWTGLSWFSPREIFVSRESVQCVSKVRRERGAEFIFLSWPIFPQLQLSFH